MKKVISRKNGSKFVFSDYSHVKPKVQLQFQQASDVNNIVKMYQKNPDPTIFRGMGTFQDTTLLGTYQDSLDLVDYAQQASDQLPAPVRDRFRNDPAQLLAFMQDPKNYDEGVSLGLVDPKSQNPYAIQKQTNSNEQNQNASQKPKNDPEGTETKKTST